MLKFLHVADVHLDTSFYSKNENLRKKLRDGIRKSFSKAVDLCIDEKVQGLLIAGDLFDNDRLSFKTEQFLIREFCRLKDNNIKVFYATGNHDPGHMSYRVNSIKWPDNVYLFKDNEIKRVDIKDFNGKTLGKIISCGHRTNNDSRNLVKAFPQREGKIPHIGLVHTMVTNVKNSENHNRYLPCSKEDLESKNYDYWALGHIHKRLRVSDRCDIYYPGNIQGRHPRETGKKGGLLVSIDENCDVKVEFRTLSTIEWHSINVNGLEDIKEYSQLKKYISSIIGDYIKENSLLNRELILRVELEGRAFLKAELSLQENLEEMVEELTLDMDLLELEIKVDRLVGRIDGEDYKGGNHVLALVLEVLRDIGEDEEILNRLLEIPLLKKGIGKREEKIAYIRELLGGIDEEAVGYMVGDRYEDK